VRSVFRALLLAEAVLVALAIWLGMGTGTRESLLHHFQVGLLTSIFTLFIHCLVMFYLIGSGKDVRRAVEEHPELRERFLGAARSLKRRCFPIATFAILGILLAAFAGAWVHSELLIQHGLANEGRAGSPEALLPVRAVRGWWIHLALLIPALGLSAVAFLAEAGAIRGNVEMIEALNQELAARMPQAARGR
jgi:hypothetical protein